MSLCLAYASLAILDFSGPVKGREGIGGSDGSVQVYCNCRFVTWQTHVDDYVVDRGVLFVQLGFCVFVGDHDNGLFENEPCYGLMAFSLMLKNEP